MSKKIMLADDITESIYNDYLKLLEGKGNILVEIEELASKYDLESPLIVKALLQYINEHIQDREPYADIFDHLLTLKNSSNEAHLYLDSQNVSLPYLVNNLDNYLNKYRPDIIVIFPSKKTKLLNLLKKYEAHLAIKKKQEVYQTEVLDKIYLVLEDFINSPYGVERFCLARKMSTSLLNPKISNSYISKIKNYNPELYQKVLGNLAEKKEKFEKGAKEAVKKLFYFMKTMPDFSLIDFMQITAFDPSDLIVEAKKYLTNSEDQIFFKITINKIYTKLIQTGLFNGNSYKVIVEAGFSYGSNGNMIEITKEEREKISNFLSNLGIPINNQIYNLALDKYIEGQLYNQNYDIENISLEYQRMAKESSTQLIDIKKLADSFNLKKEECLRRLSYCLNYQIISTKETQIFQTIIREAKEKTLNNLNTYLYQNGVNPDEIETEFFNYLVARRPDVLYNSKLVKRTFTLIKSYAIHFEQEKFRDMKAEKAKDLVVELINSGYSMVRFAQKKGISMEKFKDFLEAFKGKYEDTDLDKQLTDYLAYFLDENHLNQALNNLLLAIKDPNLEITYLDFYLLTRYDPKELISFGDKNLSNEDIKLLRTTSKLYKSRLANVKEDTIQKSELIATSFSFINDGEVIETSEEKRREVTDILDRLYIPNESKTFYDAIVRYYLGTLKTNKHF